MATSNEHAGTPASMVDQAVERTFSHYATQTWAVAAAEVQKLYHDRSSYSPARCSRFFG